MSKQHVFNKADGIKAIAWLSSLIASLDDKKKYVVEVKQYRKGRSHDANAYCWLLIGKLAKKTGYSKDEIYKNAIRKIGSNYEVISVREEGADKLCKAWELHGLGWQTEKFKSIKPGRINVLMYYGSSVYDTKQMSHLIDNIVQDCQSVGIETMSPEDLKSLKESWVSQ